MTGPRAAAPSLAIALLLSLVVLVESSSAAPVPVACGDVVRGFGILTADLDCSASPPISIEYGRLDLGGFTLASRIVCTGSCKVANGTLQGSIQGFKAVDVRNVDVSAGDDGIIADKGVRVRDSSVHAWGRCISSYYGKVIVENTDVTYCRWEGVQAYQNNARVYGSTISGARQSGVEGRKVLIKDSIVTGNAYSAECNHPTSALNRVCSGGPDAGVVCGPTVDCFGGTCEHKTQCGDLNAWKKPVLRNSTCETSTVQSSSQTTPPQTWGVCSLD